MVYIYMYKNVVTDLINIQIEIVIYKNSYVVVYFNMDNQLDSSEESSSLFFNFSV